MEAEETEDLQGTTTTPSLPVEPSDLPIVPDFPTSNVPIQIIPKEQFIQT